MLFLRPYSYTDANRIASWWKAKGENPPPASFYPPESTMIAEDGTLGPVLSVSIIYTNIPICRAENLVGNPDVPASLRQEAQTLLWTYVTKEAKARGYKAIECITSKEKLASIYEELGFKPDPSPHIFMIKEFY